MSMRVFDSIGKTYGKLIKVNLSAREVIVVMLLLLISLLYLCKDSIITM